MAQRTALLIDGENVGGLRTYGWELDYPRVLKAAGRGDPGRADGGFARTVVIAHVYLESRDAPGAGWHSFMSFLQGQGYVVSVCDNGGVHVQMVHDLLVYTLTGRIDAAILICGDGATLDAGFDGAVRTVGAHGVQVETWALDRIPDSLKRETRFKDLKDTTLLRAVG